MVKIDEHSSFVKWSVLQTSILADNISLFIPIAHRSTSKNPLRKT